MKKTEKAKHAVKNAAQAETDRCIAVLLTAFSSDPVMRWSYPESQNYLKFAPLFFKAFGGKAFNHKSAYRSNRFESVALWLPPNIEPDADAMVRLITKSTPQKIQKDISSILGQMDSFHPKEPSWYLPLIGVDPIFQGNGFGSSLLYESLKKIDKEKKIAYLESSNPKNIPLYERHGFKVIGEIQSGSSPKIWPMLRKP